MSNGGASNAQGLVEVLDYKPFRKETVTGAVGMVFGKITHCLTTNYFSELVYPFQIGDDGKPDISLTWAVDAIRYEICSEILVALQYLQGNEWIKPELTFVIEALPGYDKVVISGWSETDTHLIEFAELMGDICLELQYSDLTFSQDWYFAKMCQLHFDDPTCTEKAFNIGILASQMWWKTAHEEDAMRGLKNQDAIIGAKTAMLSKTRTRSAKKDELIAEYWKVGVREFGANTMRLDSNAAQAIYAIAERRRPASLIMKTSGKIIGVEAIRKRLTALRTEGKIG